MDRKAWSAALLGLIALLSGTGLRVVEALPAAVAAWVIAGMCAAYLGAHWLGAASSRPALYWRWDWPWWGRVPLSAAAELAFKRLKGTKFDKRASREPTPEKRLDYMAACIAYEAREIYGRRPPAELRALTQLEIHAMFIKGGGTRLHGLENPEPYVEELHIDRDALWYALKVLRQYADEK